MSGKSTAGSESGKDETAGGQEDPGTEQNGPTSLTYVSWDNVQKLLRTAKHSLRLEHDFIAARAAADQLYAESLEKIAGDLRVALRNDPLLEYGPHKDVLWGMAEEAFCLANYHSRVACNLLEDSGPCEAIKRLRNQTCHKKLNLPVKTSQEIEELHHQHRSIYGPLLSDIINANVIANKYDKKMKEACDLGDKLQHAQVKFRGPIGIDQRLRLQREETELLNKESTAVCLADQFNCRVRRIQGHVTSVRPKSEDFMAKLVQREEDRLVTVLAQFSHYLKCVGITESEGTKHKKMVEGTKDQLLNLDPSEITWNWWHSNEEKINLPKPMTNNGKNGPGVVKTLLVPKHTNPYGHREKISELFRAQEEPAERSSARQDAEKSTPSPSVEGRETSPPPVSMKIEKRTPIRRRKPAKKPVGGTAVIDLEGLTSDVEEQRANKDPTSTKEELSTSRSRRKTRNGSQKSATTKKDRYKSPSTLDGTTNSPILAWESDSSNDTF